MPEENLNEQKLNNQDQEIQEENKPRSRWFGRGIYQSKDVPIRLLDGMIVGFIAVIILLTVIFAINGGFVVTFDSNGGSEVASQKLRYGQQLEMPGEPAKPGYEFNGWYQDGDSAKTWDFEVNNVGGDLTLTADWVPAGITVKFDLAGGSCEGQESIAAIELTYQKEYGLLPIPVKEGAEFKGWIYSGELIHSDTIVSMPGEHVLTAVWE